MQNRLQAVECRQINGFVSRAAISPRLTVRLFKSLSCGPACPVVDPGGSLMSNMKRCKVKISSR
jgi:hypothetical protein